MEFYEHPTLGPIPLTIHPDKPDKLVAVHGGQRIVEMDKPEDWGVEQEVEEPPSIENEEQVEEEIEEEE